MIKTRPCHICKGTGGEGNWFHRVACYWCKGTGTVPHIPGYNGK